MERRRLGNQGLEVSAIGFGAMGIAGVAGMPAMYGAVDETEAEATILRSLDLGMDFIDTAEVYGPWRNEEVLGRVLTGQRHRTILATKFGFRISAEGRIEGVDGRPENVRRALDGCLKRLRTDHVDLWYQHRRDRSVPIEETVGAMAEQVRAGKVKYLGLSEVGADTLRRAHAVHPISALQSEWSIWERNLEEPDAQGQSMIGVCRELGIGIVPYSPLGRGFLSGRVARAEELPESDYRRQDPRYQGENYERNLAIVRALEAVAKRHGATPAQVALAWLLRQGEDVVPIPGTKRRSYLEENAHAAALRLDAGDLQTLGAIRGGAGLRYSERSMASIER